MAAARDRGNNGADVADDGPYIGIDLGTTFSCVGVFCNGRVEIIPNEHDKRTTPSYVAFTDDERLIGEDAKDQAIMNPGNTVYDVKRLIGRKFQDDTVQKDMKKWPFKVTDGRPKPMIEVTVNGEVERFSAEDISGFILTKMREIAEEYLNCRISKAVITVPAYFNDFQRNATKTAASLAGLTVLQIINEPTAAAIAYAMDYVKENKKRNILVYDLGGGTFDVTILQIEGNEFVVKASRGDTHLGGADFDVLLVEHFRQEIMIRHGRRCDIALDRKALARLRMACEKAKMELSSNQDATIDLPRLINGQDFVSNITRQEFEEICLEKFQDTIEPIETVLEDAGMDFEDINDLVLVGGSTRIPRIQEMIREMFEGKELARDINPDEAVAYGAVMSAANLSDDADIVKVNVTDVCPLSLGIRVMGGTVEWLIPRNTAIPCEKSRVFTTTKDDMTCVKVRVVQGERPMADDNAQLGEFMLEGIPKQKKGKPQIKVTFSIDASGILSVISRDVDTDVMEQLQIKSTCDIPEKKIIEMIENAKAHRNQDQEVKDRIAARNELHVLCTEEKKKPHLSGQMGKILKWWDKNPRATLQQLESMTVLVGKLMTLEEECCDKLLDCLHLCCGVRGEAQCMPCLYCGPGNQRARDECTICMDPLSSAPSIMLKCKHVIHAECCRDLLRKRFPGPRITFAFANCPVGCDKEIEHESLIDILKPIREEKQEVMRKAYQRLQYEKLDKDPEITRPNGRFFANPTGFAMHRYAYYECSRCQKPYFGGEARCEEEAAEEAGQEFDPNNLMCPSCSGGAGKHVCGKHGPDYQGYKCRYCCSMAIYFCFGTTHFCDKCHSNHGRLVAAAAGSLPKCPVGPGSVQLAGECPLKINHPATGEEYYLGCSICQNVADM